MLPVRRALISVSDKTGLEDLARGLQALGVEILSTGGTFRHLQGAGVEVIPVSDVTGFPEILDGRVKTLHPNIHGGILADRGRASHLTEVKEHGITPIDLVAVNLYPFQRTATAEGVTSEEVVEAIDVGGPSMVRGAAKNFQGVVVVVDPEDYPQVLTALEEGQGRVPERLRRSLAAKAFRHIQGYDAAIARWLEEGLGDREEKLRRHLMVDLALESPLRYGENPHQAAALYRLEGSSGVLGGFQQLQGKELSWNNLLDADAARRLVALFEEPAVVIVKHNNPCGVGLGSGIAEAFERAVATDPVSAFGSIVAVNRTVGADFVEAMSKLFVEVLMAPGFEPEALERLSAKAGLRALECPVFQPRPGALELRALEGGYLVQEPDEAPDDPALWTCPTSRQPSEQELAALELAWKVARHVKSNAIVIANQHQTVGVGAGQMSRVDSCQLAVTKAQLPTQGAVAASDAFFPFRDGLDVLARAGVVAVVQPGGSKRDGEVIAAADEHEMAMLFTGQRHFKH